MKHRPHLILCAILLCAAIDPLLAQTKRRSYNMVNWGIRGGATSPISIIHEVATDDISTEPPTLNSEVSYLGSAFCRINIRNSYIQLEAELCNSLSSIDFYTNQLITTALTEEQTTIREDRTSLQIPLLYGYNFIKESPYELSIFAGPVVTHNLYQNLSIEGERRTYFDIEQEERTYTAGIIVGMATRISRFIVDFRYEYGLNPTRQTLKYTYIDSANMPITGVSTLERGINTLSFSLGVVF